MLSPVSVTNIPLLLLVLLLLTVVLHCSLYLALIRSLSLQLRLHSLYNVILLLMHTTDYVRPEPPVYSVTTHVPIPT